MAQLSPEGRHGHPKTGRVAASIATEADRSPCVAEVQRAKEGLSDGLKEANHCQLLRMESGGYIQSRRSVDQDWLYYADEIHP